MSHQTTWLGRSHWQMKWPRKIQLFKTFLHLLIIDMVYHKWNAMFILQSSIATLRKIIAAMQNFETVKNKNFYEILTEFWQNMRYRVTNLKDLKKIIMISTAVKITFDPLVQFLFAWYDSRFLRLWLMRHLLWNAHNNFSCILYDFMKNDPTKTNTYIHIYIFYHLIVAQIQLPISDIPGLWREVHFIFSISLEFQHEPNKISRLKFCFAHWEIPLWH